MGCFKQWAKGLPAGILLSALALPALSQQPLDDAAMLMERALQDDTAYRLVESLTTEVGPRMAGTQAEARARQWAVGKLQALGFSNVREERFEMPVWERVEERASIVAPFPQPLTITALGGSVSTGEKGVTGNVIRFDSLAALRQQASGSLDGAIVFVDETMTRTQDGSGYSVAVAKRRETAFEAERVGASAALIRSVGTSSHRFAHTGQMRDAGEDGKPGVPTAALAAPDADQLSRALERGDVAVNIVLRTRNMPAATSGNVIAEVPGRNRAGEIVLLGAHLDSWDLGTGAVDDGAGVGIVVAAAKLLLDAYPQGLDRTVRVVLFGAEEVGLLGAKAYNDRHAQQLSQHVLAVESDFGAGKIWRFDTGVGKAGEAAADAIGEALRPLGIAPGHREARGGPDLYFLREAGVPVIGLKQDGWDYFDLHHTANDTLDKIDPAKLRQNVAAYAVLARLAAQADQSFR